MGSGLARQLMEKYDNIRDNYISFRKRKLSSLNSDEDLLGLVNYVVVKADKLVANIFGQVDTRVNEEDTKVYTNTEALLRGIADVRDKAEENSWTVAIPTYIGCGLANGDWDEIREGIEAVFEGSPVNVAFYHYR